MVEICVRGLKTKNIINWGENVFDHYNNIRKSAMKIKDNDIIHNFKDCIYGAKCIQNYK